MRDMNVEVGIWQYDVSVNSYFVITTPNLVGFYMHCARWYCSMCSVYLSKNWCMPTQNIMF